MNKIGFILSFFLLGHTFTQAQSTGCKFNKLDSLSFVECIGQLNKLGPAASTQARVVAAAKYFIDKPYVAATLEGKTEEVRVNFQQFDCTSLVETSLALAKTSSQKPTPSQFCQILENIRYRKGVCNQYPSRLHYFTDWISDNQLRNNVQDVTKNIGGIPLPLQLNFMSTHANKYQMLVDSSIYIPIIKKQEASINKAQYYYIPKNKIGTVQDKIENGDIIAMATSISGLDVSHVGIAYWQNKELFFLHASQLAGKVIVNTHSLSTYLNQNKTRIGILVIRPL